MANSRSFFRNKFRTISLFFLISITAGLGITGCGNGDGSGRLFLVSLGDSLSVGVQPDDTGMNQTTDKGYADVLHQLLLPEFPNLQLLKLGCPGETTETMADGGICTYPAGSQLDAARQFILAHKDEILLVTIDIGVNDLLNAGCINTDVTPVQVDQPCIENFLGNVLPGRLTFVMNELFQIVDGTNITVLGMNYYNPFVVIYFQVFPLVVAEVQMDPDAQLACATQCGGVDPVCFPACIKHIAALATVEEITGVDDLAMALDFLVLKGVYDLVMFPVADIYTAFQSGDFTLVPAPEPFKSLGFDEVPLNALLACQLTFMCPNPMSGLEPNIHATDAGYQLIGQTFFELFNSL